MKKAPDFSKAHGKNVVSSIASLPGLGINVNIDIFVAQSDPASGKARAGGCGAYLLNENWRELCQRKFILRLLQQNIAMTTDDFRDLEIRHPAGRIMELKIEGYWIDTIMVPAISRDGKKRLIAKYVYRGNAWALEDDEMGGAA